MTEEDGKGQEFKVDDAIDDGHAVENVEGNPADDEAE